MRLLLSCSILAMAPALLLSGCGEDGQTFPGGSAGTPAPAPAPTPTPTPTPTSAYVEPLDFTRSWAYDTQAVTLERHFRNDGGTVSYDYGVSTLLADLNTARINYVAADGNINLAVGGSNWSFAATDINFDGATGRSYQKADRSFLSISKELPNIRYILWGSQSGALPNGGSTGKYLLFGPRTLPADIPASGMLVYHSKFFATSPETDGGSGLGGDIELHIDFATGLVEGSVTAAQSFPGSSGPEISLPMVFSGRLNTADWTISGQLLSTCRCIAYGEFTGMLYGPGAKEVGLLARMTLPDVPIVDVIGTLLGSTD